jgi:hypothetical protein
MVELPENDKIALWLFPDSVVAKDYKFVGANAEYITRNKKKCAVIHLIGDLKAQDGSILENREINVLISTIKNYDELKEQMKPLAENKIFFKISADSDGKNFIFSVVEEV